MRHYALYDHRWTKIHRPESVPGLLLELVAAVHSETGDVSRSLVAALADGRVTQREFESFDEQTIEAMTALAELRDWLRGMVVEDPVRLRRV